MSIQGQLTRDNRPVLIDFGFERVSHAANDRFGVMRAHFACRLHAGPDPLDKKIPVRIEHDLDNLGVIEGGKDRFAESVAKAVFQSPARFFRSVPAQKKAPVKRLTSILVTELTSSRCQAGDRGNMTHKRIIYTETENM